jgi:hypothetical protein
MKRFALRVLIFAVSLSALLGCIALLSSHFGETEAKVLLSTLAVAETSLLAMACGAAMARPEGAGLARIGVYLAILATPIALVGIWGEMSSDGYWKTFGTVQVLAVAVAHGALLRLARLRSERRWMLAATASLAILLVGMLLVLIWGDIHAGETFGRAIGIISILITAGTILVWVFHRMDRDELAPVGAPASLGIGLRFCVSCGGGRVEASADQVRCLGCGATFRVDLSAERPSAQDGPRDRT